MYDVVLRGGKRDRHTKKRKKGRKRTDTQLGRQKISNKVVARGTKK